MYGEPIVGAPIVDKEPALTETNAFNFLAEMLSMVMSLPQEELPFTVTVYLADGRIVTITVINKDG